VDTGTQPDTKVCSACGEVKPLVAFAPRRKRCTACDDAAKARTAERKESVAYTDVLAERIADMIAAGMTIEAVTAQPSMPTPRQLRAWRRANPDFDAALCAAEVESASAHLDRAKQVLADLETGKLQASDAKVLFDGHIKLAERLHPSRYAAGALAIDVTSQGKPLVDFGAAIEALIAALPAVPALPKPEPVIEAEAIEAETVH
jgi:hypothetical protein